MVVGKGVEEEVVVVVILVRSVEGQEAFSLTLCLSVCLSLISYELCRRRGRKHGREGGIILTLPFYHGGGGKARSLCS